MPEKRLAVRPSEILYLERECKQCHESTSLPFVEIKTSFNPSLADEILDQCPWCNHRVEQPLRAEIRALLKALCDLRTADPHWIRLVLQNGDRKDQAQVS